MKEFFSNLWTLYGAIIISLIPAFTACINLIKMFKQIKTYKNNTLVLQNQIKLNLDYCEKIKGAFLKSLDDEKKAWEDLLKVTPNKQQKSIIERRIEELGGKIDNYKKLTYEQIPTIKVKVKKQ